MKFGLVRYSTKEEMSKHNKAVSRLLSSYYKNFRPYKISPSSILSVDGVLVRMQVTPEEAEKNSVLWQKKIEEALEELCDLDAAIVIPTSTGNFPGQILRVASGRDLSGLFIMDGVKKAAKIMGRDLKETHVAIIDGKNRYTELALDRISPQINFLSVFTDRKEDYMKQAEDIYENYGLNLQLFSNAKGSLMAEADIIINCGFDTENYDYTMGKGAFYFDLAQNRPKFLRLLSRREDMTLADGMMFKQGQEFFGAREAEAASYVTSDFFRRYVCGRYDNIIATEAETALEDLGIALSYFTCLGSSVSFKDRNTERR